MANLIESALATYMAADDVKYDKLENRYPLNYGAINAVMSDTENTVNATELENALTAINRAEYISVLKRKDMSGTRNTTSSSCSFMDNSSESAKYGLSWGFYSNGFHMIPSQYVNNVIGYERDFAHKMDALKNDVLKTLNDAAIALLEANKSEVNRASGNPYTITGNTVVVPTTNQDMFFNEISPMMFMNDLDGTNLKMVASPRLQAYVNKLNAQGGGNNTNLAFQEYLGQNYNLDRFLTIPTTARDVVYMFVPGSVGMLTWIEIDNRGNGAESTDGMIWGNMDLLPGLNVGTMRKSTCADASTETGGGIGDKSSLKDQFKIEFYYSFVHAYNSVPSVYPGSIFKAQLTK